jgi:hypothetical protein
MPLQPLPPEDDRVEELTFKDKSWLEIDAPMRAKNPRVYAETCELAVSRRFPVAIDANAKRKFTEALDTPNG